MPLRHGPLAEETRSRPLLTPESPGGGGEPAFRCLTPPPRRTNAPELIRDLGPGGRDPDAPGRPPEISLFDFAVSPPDRRLFLPLWQCSQTPQRVNVGIAVIHQTLPTFRPEPQASGGRQQQALPGRRPLWLKGVDKIAIGSLGIGDIPVHFLEQLNRIAKKESINQAVVEQQDLGGYRGRRGGAIDPDRLRPADAGGPGMRTEKGPGSCRAEPSKPLPARR